MSGGRLQPFRRGPTTLTTSPRRTHFSTVRVTAGQKGATPAMAAFPWVIAPCRSRLTIGTTKATAANSRRVGIRLLVTSRDRPCPSAL